MTRLWRRPPPSQERVREVFDYDPNTGILHRRCKSRNTKPGPTGCKHKGHITVSVDNVRYMAHRIIWLWVTGKWPDEIDHKDTDGFNNKWKNLRVATRSDNSGNTRVRQTNKIGVKGVSWSTKSNKWHSRVVKHGKVYICGYFDTIEEAKIAYDKKAAVLFEEFARST